LEKFEESNDIGTGFKLIVDGKLIINILFDFSIFCQDFITDDFNSKDIGVFQVSGLEDLTVGARA
jgi:hypothetical protein